MWDYPFPFRCLATVGMCPLQDNDTVFIVQEMMTGGDLGSVIDVSPLQYFCWTACGLSPGFCPDCVALVQSFRGRGQLLFGPGAKKITEPVVARIVYECLSLLATAHSRGFAHLDVKPVCSAHLWVLV
jgi:serine/threonine protein kinase